MIPVRAVLSFSSQIESLETIKIRPINCEDFGTYYSNSLNPLTFCPENVIALQLGKAPETDQNLGLFDSVSVSVMHMKYSRL